MEEGRLRNDDSLIKMGAQMLDWVWARGWDGEWFGFLPRMLLTCSQITERMLPR